MNSKFTNNEPSWKTLKGSFKQGHKDVTLPFRNKRSLVHNVTNLVLSKVDFSTPTKSLTNTPRKTILKKPILQNKNILNNLKSVFQISNDQRFSKGSGEGFKRNNMQPQSCLTRGNASQTKPLVQKSYISLLSKMQPTLLTYPSNILDKPKVKNASYDSLNLSSEPKTVYHDSEAQIETIQESFNSETLHLKNIFLNNTLPMLDEKGSSCHKGNETNNRNNENDLRNDEREVLDSTTICYCAVLALCETVEFKRCKHLLSRWKVSYRKAKKVEDPGMMLAKAKNIKNEVYKVGKVVSYKELFKIQSTSDLILNHFHSCVNTARIRVMSLSGVCESVETRLVDLDEDGTESREKDKKVWNLKSEQILGEVDERFCRQAVLQSDRESSFSTTLTCDFSDIVDSVSQVYRNSLKQKASKEIERIDEESTKGINDTSKEMYEYLLKVSKKDGVKENKLINDEKILKSIFLNLESEENYEKTAKIWKDKGNDRNIQQGKHKTNKINEFSDIRGDEETIQYNDSTTARTAHIRFKDPIAETLILSEVENYSNESREVVSSNTLLQECKPFIFQRAYGVSPKPTPRPRDKTTHPCTLPIIQRLLKENFNQNSSLRLSERNLQSTPDSTVDESLESHLIPTPDSKDCIESSHNCKQDSTWRGVLTSNEGNFFGGFGTLEVTETLSPSKKNEINGEEISNEETRQERSIEKELMNGKRMSIFYGEPRSKTTCGVSSFLRPEDEARDTYGFDKDPVNVHCESSDNNVIHDSSSDNNNNNNNCMNPHSLEHIAL